MIEATVIRKRRALEKAREVKHIRQRREKNDLVWQAMLASAHLHDCKCGLRKGMTLEQLRQLGVGCTDPRYVCPSLDKYRRMLGH